MSTTPTSTNTAAETAADAASQTLPTDVRLAERLRDALRVPAGGGGDLAMSAALRHRHPADIADAMRHLARPEALAVFNWLDNARAAEALDELEPDLVRYITDNAPPGRIADLLDRLPMDDAAEVVSEAAPERAEEILENLEARAPEDAAEVRELLSYEENTAGRLMTDKYLRLSADMTVDEAYALLRNPDREIEALTDLYVVEQEVQEEKAGGDETQEPPERLIGVVNLRRLVRSQPASRIGTIMAKGPITVTVDTDQEEVARVIAKYDFLAIPVLDREGYLAGIITVDDVLDVLVEEQTEDVLALGAVTPSETPYAAVGVLATVRQRAVWLLLLFVASMFTGSVSRHFEGEVQKVVALATFIPLLIGTGGNAGAQAVMTVTRALALGEVTFSDWARVLWREMRTGMVLGGVLAVAGFFFVRLFWHESGRLALTIAFSLIAIVVWANIVGSLLPIAARRLGLDPAVMSAPFITTLVDATGLFLYFTIARAVLGL